MTIRSTADTVQRQTETTLTAGQPGLPRGVAVVPLSRRSDPRGSLTEIYRAAWIEDAYETVQWNHVVSRPNVLRGLHVHHRHWDYLYMVAGVMQLALVDIRDGTVGAQCVLTLDADEPQGVSIPPGVAHGFFFPNEAVLVYGVSHCWDPEDELGCRWDDPALSLGWNAENPALSPRDRDAGSLADMITAWQTARRRVTATA